MARRAVMMKHAANAGVSLFSLDPVHPRLAAAMAALKTELSPEFAAAKARFDATGVSSGILHSCSDITLHRFLIGDDLNAVKAAASIRASLAWREKVGADASRLAQQKQAFVAAGLAFPATEMRTNVYVTSKGKINYKMMQDLPGAPCAMQQPHYDTGYGHFQFGTREWHFWATDGSPIAVRNMGRTDPATFLVEGRPEKYLEMLMNYNEMMRLSMEMMSLEQKRLVRFHTVIDLGGLGVKHMAPKAVTVFKSMADVLADNYPEVVHKMLVINAPWIFASLYSLLKPWIPAETQNKITIVGADYRATLDALMPRAEWPVLYGGNVPTAKHLVLPRSFDPTACVGASVDDVRTAIAIGAGSAEKHAVYLRAGASCAYTVVVDERDIDFSVEFVPGAEEGAASKGAAVVLQAPSRITGTASMGVGEHAATEAGTLYLCFDNAYSWMRSKSVVATVCVTAPGIPGTSSED